MIHEVGAAARASLRAQGPSVTGARWNPSGAPRRGLRPRRATSPTAPIGRGLRRGDGGRGREPRAGRASRRSGGVVARGRPARDRVRGGGQGVPGLRLERGGEPASRRARLLGRVPSRRPAPRDREPRGRQRVGPRDRPARLATVGDFRERSVIRGAFSPDGSRLAVIAWDQTGSILSCETWREERKLKGLGRPRGVCWSPDGSCW